MFLKMIEDLKEIAFIWTIGIKVYLIRKLKLTLRSLFIYKMINQLQVNMNSFLFNMNNVFVKNNYFPEEK